MRTAKASLTNLKGLGQVRYLGWDNKASLIDVGKFYRTTPQR